LHKKSEQPLTGIGTEVRTSEMKRDNEDQDQMTKEQRKEIETTIQEKLMAINSKLNNMKTQLADGNVRGNHLVQISRTIRTIKAFIQKECGSTLLDKLIGQQPITSVTNNSCGVPDNKLIELKSMTGDSVRVIQAFIQYCENCLVNNTNQSNPVSSPEVQARVDQIYDILTSSTLASTPASSCIPSSTLDATIFIPPIT